MNLKIKKLLTIVVLLLAAGVNVRGQEVIADTLAVKIHFYRGKYNLAPEYRGNQERLDDFYSGIKDLMRDMDYEVDTITVRTSASPEGYTSANQTLSEDRASTIVQWLCEKAGFSRSKIMVNAVGEDWDGFEKQVEELDKPWKDEVLAIIRDKADLYNIGGYTQDRRKDRLKMIDGGDAWKWMDENLFPDLRAAGGDVSCVVRRRAYGSQPKDTIYMSQRDTVVVRDTLIIIHDYPEDFPYVAGFRAKKIKVPADQTPSWAVKSNLLMLGALAPNVQVEIPLGTRNRWSLETELICPWWTFSHNAYAEQLLNLGVELRYWLGERQYHRWLDGWHMGLAVAAGYYDLEWKSRGAQGEHVNAYFNIGYQHRWGIRRQWGIDAGVGLGAIYTPRHRQYLGSTLFPENHTEEYDDHLMYQRHSDLLWPGATHANVSLMYFFDWNRK